MTHQLFYVHCFAGPDGTQTYGPNAVISMLDYALTEHSFGEQICTLHADNCPG